MNDLELAKSISDEVGEQYALAKEVAKEYPGYSLLTLRGMCGLICQRIIEVQKLAIPKLSELGTLIREICDRTHPDVSSKDALHKLRFLGNKGAHPEEGKLANEQLSEFADSALKHALTALKFAYRKIHPALSLADSIAVTPVGSGMKELCYRAISEEEAEAQYWIGKHFLNKATEMQQPSINEGNESPLVYAIDINEARRKADFWFELAAHKDHPAALFEHGCLLVEGVKGADYVMMGVNKIFGSAKAGYPDANAFIGHVFYHGLYDQPQDFVEARIHFELAAKEDHPSALTMLGVMHLHGEGGPENPQAAFDYTKKSAEAGYPTGQLNMFVHYWNGNVVERDTLTAIDWLNKAVAQNHPEALLVLAGLIEEEHIPEHSLEQAEELYSRCMSAAGADKSLRTKAGFHYARLLSRHSDRLQSLTNAAYVLQQCYEAEECRGEIADACLECSPRVIKQIKKLITSHQGSAEEIFSAEVVTKYFFDNSGKPIPKKSIGLAKLGQAMRDMSQLKNDISPELYERRLMEKFASTLQAQSKGNHSLQLVCSSRTKIGRNEPCICGSGRKYKHCCANN
ncbi:hypothetical protein AZSI13_29290 [Azospira sp. I13]|uniref:tetratricopeptide repeat protein n=1 Tax=Azospira sp. I13 TaxID=1765050 RepID=UPI000D43AF6B|nr:tetratricopeptide repeat protein [Azospira sp. I13]GBG03602.1 hypothetical protein AZSI13_29290 [Azospira sp. I13]